jgi:hypothetical protein
LLNDVALNFGHCDLQHDLLTSQHRDAIDDFAALLDEP